MHRLKVVLGLGMLVLIVGSSCSKFQKIRKSPDWETKYEAALEYYEEKDFFRTSILLEEILPIIRGTKEAELANFIYAYSYYYQDQYILSAHHFQTFATVYSRSEYAMEAEYMYAYSLYQQSPGSELDQTSTYEAIAALQLFINKYPYSDFAVEADKIIDELQVKLEKKAYQNAKLYHTIRRYKAAIIAFDNFKNDFPDSKYQDEIAYLAVDAAYQYAMVSIQEKQLERFEKAVELYHQMVDKFPNSSYLKKAEEIYSKTVEELTIFADQNNS
jgi:outer membrane protein assembly factor BamD